MVVSFALALLHATSLEAQEPTRPRLEASADTNDWEAYHNRGLEKWQRNRGEADAAFYWASRLDPTRAEPLFARWAMVWIKEPRRFVKYLNDDRETLESRDVLQADSLRAIAFQRNPFVLQSLLMAIYSRLPGGYLEDYVSTAWVAYARGELGVAAARFGRAIASDPKRNAYLRFVRASALVNLQQPDSALAEITELLTFLRAAEGKELELYSSKELLEYAAGRLYSDRRDFTRAADAFGRALVENAAFAPAHYGLGAMAQLQKDWDKALLEYGLAVELDPGDVAARLAYANALYYDRRGEEGVKQVRAAIELEPHYAESYGTLAMMYDRLEDTKAAREAYQRYIAIAPRRSAAGIIKAKQRLQELGTP